MVHRQGGRATTKRIILSIAVLLFVAGGVWNSVEGGQSLPEVVAPEAIASGAPESNGAEVAPVSAPASTMPPSAVCRAAPASRGPGIACNSRNRGSTTPLMRAAFAGAEQTVVRLLDEGADPNARCSGDGATPTLMLLAPLFAVRFASADQVASAPLPLPPGLGTDADLRARRSALYALLSSGAEPDARQGETHPLTVATILEQVWAVEALVAFGADPDRAPNLLRAARMVGNPDISRLLGIE